jgi:Antibiotic biosynthesis monooxygenase
MPRIKRILADYFLKLSAPIRSIRADPRSIPQWLLENTLAARQRLGGLMMNIAVTNNVVTFITVYEVAPADQQHLIDLITSAYEQTIRHLPGFVEAHTHRSSDGVRIVSYAQWNAQADVEAMIRNSELWPIFVEIGRIASADPRYYQVAADWTPV